jgi:hypothetical protein
VAVGTTREPHPYEPKCKDFVLDTLCRAITHARSWDGVLSGAEAIARTLDIAKEIEAEALRTDFSAVALEQLKESGRELRGLQNGESNETSNT